MFFPERIARKFMPPPPLRATAARRLRPPVMNTVTDRVIFSRSDAHRPHENGAARTAVLQTYAYEDALESLTRELAALRLALQVAQLYGGQARPRIGFIGRENMTGRLPQRADHELRLRQSRLLPQAVALVAAAETHIAIVGPGCELRRLALQLTATRRVLRHLQRPRPLASEQATARRLRSLDANSM